MKTLSLFSFLFLSITLSAQNFIGNQKDIDQILSNVKEFSASVMASDYEALTMAYTEDAKLFPTNQEIIEGHEAIRKFWDQPEGFQTKYHKIMAVEIKILGDEAYDYGYYEGTTLKPDGTEINWKGKYVVIWKKVDQDWKIYLDIWNRIKD